jgi:hypothetical protein
VNILFAGMKSGKQLAISDQGLVTRKDHFPVRGMASANRALVLI